MPRFAVTSTSAVRAVGPLSTVTAMPGIAAPAVGELVVTALPGHVAASTGPPGAIASTVRQRLSMWAVLPAAPLIRHDAAIVWVPGPSGMTAVAARVS